MGFFGWLGGLVDDFLSWLGNSFIAFINAVVERLESIWDKIQPRIEKILGYVQVLSFIIIEELGEIIIELWDPNNRQKGSVTKSLGKSSKVSLSPNQTLPPPRVFNIDR
jgi:hypothetical protein